jgi:hypothetical protein
MQVSDEAMTYIENFKKYSYISVIYVAKPKSIAISASIYLLESLTLPHIILDIINPKSSRAFASF